MLPLLFLLMILFPIAEIYVIIQVGEAIGLLPTLALLVLDGILGAALARSQGRAVVARFQQAMNEGRVPTREAFDGAMVAVGGGLLLAPGFITDVIGFSLLFPPTRAVIRSLIARSVKRRRGSVLFGVGGLGGRPGRGPQGPPPGWPSGGPDPFASRQQRPDYDYEGTARDVTEPPEALDEATGRDRSDDPHG